MSRQPAEVTEGTSDDEDEWGAEEIHLQPSRPFSVTPGDVDKGGPQRKEDQDGDGGDAYWDEDDQPTASQNDGEAVKNENESGGEPMLIVDLTKISNSAVHSKHDRNSVNDPVAASKLRREIESKYEEYGGNSSLVADGTVIPCGTSVWRMALTKLRSERPGHYLAPIFPPKKK